MMRLGTVLLLALGGCRAAPTVDRAAEANRIRAVEDQWRDAVARRDFAGLAALYTADAREMLSGMPAIVGRDSIEAFFRTWQVQHPRFAFRFTPDAIDVAVSGDLAVVRGHYRFTPDSLVPHQYDAGKFVGVWKRDGDAWRAAIDIANSDAPAAPAP
jgi:uncharacterized protein (TIGR02246 family)